MCKIYADAGFKWRIEAMMDAKILRLNKAGLPLGWLTREETATLMVKEQIVWSVGESVLEIRGGYNRLGVRSVLALPSIIACHGKVRASGFHPPLCNTWLFRRDQNTCLYCGKQFSPHELSRDHVRPTSRGGKDRWTNVVTACKRCNHHKGAKTPEEANLQLIAVPFVPNRYEFLYLTNRNVLADQMEFLQARFSNNGWWA